MDSIFAGNLLTSRDQSSLSGYQSTFPDFIKSLRAAATFMPPTGSVHIDLNKPAVLQLWPEVVGIIRTVNRTMKPFLNLFGVEEGNGLSPFLTTINDPATLVSLIEGFFCPPAQDQRDMVPNSSSSDSNNEAVVDNEGGDSDDDHGSGSVDEGETEFPLAGFIQDIRKVKDNDDQNDGEDDVAEVTVSGMRATDTDEPTSFNDENGGVVSFELGNLLESKDIATMGCQVVKIMELMQLGKHEKGSIVPDGKYKSLNARWFGCQKKLKDSKGHSVEDSGIYIRRDTLIKMKCKRGRSETIEYYRVFAIFSKGYNKWWIHLDDDKVLFVPGSKKYKIFGRMMMQEQSGEMKEVELEKNGEWGPKSIFTIRHMSEIESVEDYELIATEWN